MTRIVRDRISEEIQKLAEDKIQMLRDKGELETKLENKRNDLQEIERSVSEQIAKLDKSVKDSFQKVELAKDSLNSLLSKHDEFVKRLNVFLDGVFPAVKSLLEFVELKEKEIRELEIKSLAIHESCVKEEANLDKKKGDLNIYASRIKKKMEEILPNQKFVI